MPPNSLPLKEIHLPDAIGWWPPAIGWWLLIILVPLCIAMIIWLYKRITRKTAKKTANKLLHALRQDDSNDSVEKIKQLSTILRRVAISTAPRAEVASLTGEAWLQYLDRSLNDMAFSQGVGRALIEAPYCKPTLVNTDLDELISLCERWLKAQRN